MSTNTGPGLLGRLRERLEHFGAPAEQLEKGELRERSASRGCCSIEQVSDRRVETVSGHIRSTTLRPRSEVAALVAELYDGSRSLHLVWIGRREIGGIHCGAELRATGRVTMVRGIPTIFNPSYELVPTRRA